MQLSLLCDNECRLFQISFERIAFYIKNYEGRKEFKKETVFSIS